MFCDAERSSAVVSSRGLLSKHSNLVKVGMLFSAQRLGMGGNGVAWGREVLDSLIPE